MKEGKKIRILYVSYDGMTDALGQSQVIAYLKRHDKSKFQIDILSFEKKETYESQRAIVEESIQGSAVTWHRLFYTKKPPVLSTLKDIWKGLSKAKALHRQHPYDIVHCRGYIAAVIGLRLKKDFGLKFIFDMRGWLPDEKLESGHWDSVVYKPVYSYLKKLEKQFFKKADYVVSLTNIGKEEIVKQDWQKKEKIGVIPTCVDFEIFKAYDPRLRSEIRKSLQISEEAKVMVYSGALGGNYDAGDLLVLFKKFAAIYQDAYLLVLSKDDPEGLAKIFSSIDSNRYRMKSVAFRDVFKYLIASDLGVVFYKRSFSTIGRSPTKLGEYWACGVPVISYTGIGDLEMIMNKYPAGGGLVSSFKEETTNAVLVSDAMVRPDKELLRKHAIDYFDIEKGCLFYREVYEKLALTRD